MASPPKPKAAESTGEESRQIAGEKSDESVGAEDLSLDSMVSRLDALIEKQRKRLGKSPASVDVAVSARHIQKTLGAKPHFTDAVAVLAWRAGHSTVSTHGGSPTKRIAEKAKRQRMTLAKLLVPVGHSRSSRIASDVNKALEAFPEMSSASLAKAVREAGGIEAVASTDPAHVKRRKAVLKSHKARPRG